MAVVYYQEAVKRKPHSPSVYNNFGLVLAKLGRYKEAMDEVGAAARMDVSAARPQYLMGWLLLQQGHDIEAMSYLHQALRLEPDNLEVLILTASVLAADENPQVRNGAEARKLAERAVDLTNGQQAVPFDTLAMSYAETGRFDKAVQFQKQAIKLANIMNQKEDVALMQQRLQLYEKHQPWRGSFKKK
jgi:Tfp pilus assembly protein PilF